MFTPKMVSLVAILSLVCSCGGISPSTTADKNRGDSTAGGDTDCNSDLDCAAQEYCEQFCYFYCEAGDPGCCEPGICQALEEPELEQEGCLSDADCAVGEQCAQICLFWCEVGDPACCQPGVCEPAPEQTEPEQTEPESTDPEQTEPEQEEPESTEPEQEEPESTEPESTEECLSDQDCEQGQQCTQFCYFYCEVDDPSCCESGFCE